MEERLVLKTILRSDALPTLPDVVHRILEITGDPLSSTRRLTRVIERDPPLSANLLRLVNSAYFGFSGKINSVAAALAEPHTQARQMVETVEHPSAGMLKMLGIPFRFSDTACTVRLPPPTLGQHAEEILTNELGLDAQAVAQLRQEKVI